MCSNCGKTGHEKNNCWQIIGYPEWMNEKRGRGGSGRGRGGGNMGAGRGAGRGTAHTAHTTSSHGTGSSDITPEQWRAITQIINEGKSSAQSEKLSGKTLGDVIIDSGASHHMTGDISLLVNVKETLPCVVGFADGGKSTLVQMGDMILTDHIALKDVLYVPKLDCTLIFVSKLMKHSNCFAVFTDSICVLQDRSLKTLIGAGEEHHGVYFFRDVAQASRAVGSDDQLLWHRRLGHPAFSISSTLSSLSSVLNKACSSPCDVCFRAKQTRDVFYDSINKTSQCFELIHLDVWGPYRVPSSCGATYFLTVVDDFSRAVWTYLLLGKSEVKKVVQRFCAYAVKQFGKEVKTVCSDNVTEFMCLEEYFQDNGIIHQTSCVDTPQQNGRVERKHRHILNVARSLCFNLACRSSSGVRQYQRRHMLLI